MVFLNTSLTCQWLECIYVQISPKIASLFFSHLSCGLPCFGTSCSQIRKFWSQALTNIFRTFFFDCMMEARSSKGKQTSLVEQALKDTVETKPGLESKFLCFDSIIQRLFQQGGLFAVCRQVDSLTTYPSSLWIDSCFEQSLGRKDAYNIQGISFRFLDWYMLVRYEWSNVSDHQLLARLLFTCRFQVSKRSNLCRS